MDDECGYFVVRMTVAYGCESAVTAHHSREMPR